MTRPQVVLRMEHITFRYGDVIALNEVDFNLFKGEIHAVAGDHRSGKTTLGKIISGAERKQGGTIWFDGREVSNLTISKAVQAGIGMVYQVQKSLVPCFNAIDNMYSGNRPGFLITRKDKAAMTDEARKLLANFAVDIPLDMPMYRLGERDRQIVNICHVLSRKPKVLILDDIISSLLPAEMEQVFHLLRLEKQRGTAIVYITSNLNDVFKIADRVTILQDGCRRGTEQVMAIDPARLVDLAFTSSTSGDDAAREAVRMLDAVQEAIIDDLPIGELIIDTMQRIVCMNKQARRLLKPVPPTWRNRPLDQVFSWLPVEELEHLRTVLAKRRTESFEGIRLDDKILRFTCSPIINRKKQQIGSNVFIEDVSFDYQTKEYLMQAKKAASVAELASGVAHEIKNPLAIMQNYLELLKLADLGSEERGHVQHIDSELQRISEIIGSLVSFSRVKQLPFQPLCLQQVVNEVLMLLGHRFSAKNIRLVKRMESMALVSGDENKLKQLFMNLVVNSLEAVLDEGLIEIEVSENGSDGTLSVSVSDNGHGISDAERDKIFYPFYTTKMTRANIGLGLSICQNIVESHKGIVKFSSIPGRRTTFTVTLPMLLTHSGM